MHGTGLPNRLDQGREGRLSQQLYEVSIPVLIAGLRNTASFLERGRVYADQAGIDHAAMLGARLAPDMMSLTEQVQRASDTSKGAAVRVGGVENVPMPDNEKTFD